VTRRFHPYLQLDIKYLQVYVPRHYSRFLVCEPKLKREGE